MKMTVGFVRMLYSRSAARDRVSDFAPAGESSPGGVRLAGADLPGEVQALGGAATPRPVKDGSRYLDGLAETQRTNAVMAAIVRSCSHAGQRPCLPRPPSPSNWTSAEPWPSHLAEIAPGNAASRCSWV